MRVCITVIVYSNTSIFTHLSVSVFSFSPYAHALNHTYLRYRFIAAQIAPAALLTSQ